MVKAWFVLLWSVCVVCAHSQEVFRDDELGFEFVPPEGWIRMTPAELALESEWRQVRAERIGRDAGGESIVGFKVALMDGYEPYVVVRYRAGDYAELSWADIAKVHEDLSAGGLDEEIALLREHFRGEAAGFELDHAAHRVGLRHKIESDDGEMIEAVSARFFFKNGHIDVSGSFPTEAREQLVPMIEAAIASFSLDAARRLDDRHRLVFPERGLSFDVPAGWKSVDAATAGDAHAINNKTFRDRAAETDGELLAVLIDGLNDDAQSVGVYWYDLSARSWEHVRVSFADNADPEGLPDKFDDQRHRVLDLEGLRPPEWEVGYYSSKHFTQHGYVELVTFFIGEDEEAATVPAFMQIADSGVIDDAVRLRQDAPLIWWRVGVAVVILIGLVMGIGWVSWVVYKRLRAGVRSLVNSKRPTAA
ncbi:MAG: hypothetical protein AAF747_07930 [Planctomycetota bacterium]